MDPCKNFLLIEVIEREISTPKFFGTYEEAHAKMTEFYEQAKRGNEGEINEWSAWCENANHDNCDWRIFKRVNE